MREIKFRGKPEGDDEWVYGSYYKSSNHVIVTNEVMNYKHVVVNPETVGQFIERKDGNGKEIYEGDVINDGRDDYVIKYCEHSYSNILAFHPISIKYEDAHIEYYYGEWDSERTQVVGNKTENPELMKESK